MTTCQNCTIVSGTGANSFNQAPASEMVIQVSDASDFIDPQRLMLAEPAIAPTTELSSAYPEVNGDIVALHEIWLRPDNSYDVFIPSDLIFPSSKKWSDFQRGLKSLRHAWGKSDHSTVTSRKGLANSQWSHGNDLAPRRGDDEGGLRGRAVRDSVDIIGLTLFGDLLRHTKQELVTNEELSELDKAILLKAGEDENTGIPTFAGSVYACPVGDEQSSEASYQLMHICDQDRTHRGRLLKSAQWQEVRSIIQRPLQDNGNAGAQEG